MEKGITIVIPVYNREKLVLRTLASVSAQTAAAFKVILVDNASTDGTAAVLKQWADAQRFPVRVLCETTRGAAAARQCGLEGVDTEWTMFFDSDDTMAPGHVQRALDAIAASSGAEMVGWGINYRHDGGASSVRYFVPDQYASLFHGTTSTLRYCSRTELFRKAGGWNRAMGVWDDIELGARMLALEPEAVVLDGSPTVDVFISEDSITHGETAANIEAVDRVLSSIGRTLGPARRHWIDLKLIIVAANSRGPEGEELYRRVMAQARRRRPLLRFAYVYTRMGGRGIARILKPLM